MMSRRRGVALSKDRLRWRVWGRLHSAALIAALSALALGLILPWSGQDRTTADARYAEEPCSLIAHRDADPLNPLLGSELTISTRLRTTCAPDTRPMHLVLLIDSSESMVGEPLRALQDGLERSLRGIDLHPTDRPQIAVVSFGDTAEVKRALTTSIDQIVAGLRGIEAGGSSCLDCGLDEALKVLRAGRLGEPPEGLREVVLLLSQGVEDECERVRAKANEVKAHGVVLVAACQGRTCDRGCLFETATTRRYVFAMSTWTELEFRLRELLTADGAFHPIERVILVDELSDELAYLEGGETTAVEGNRLLWVFEPWTTDVLTRTYRAGVAACGRFPLGKAEEIGVTIEYNTAFWDGYAFEHPLPNPLVVAECPTATASPTGASPSPTGTRPTEATPAPSTPTPYSPPRTWLSHLPFALSDACAPPRPALDLVIAVDVSHSMYLTPIGGIGEVGGAWRAAALVAAETVGGLRPIVDRIGVLAYGDDTGSEAFIVRRLERCCEPGLIPAPDDFWKLDGSRIDRAIIRAVAMHEEAPISPGATRAIVALTDGDLNQTRLAQLEGALRSAKRARVSIEVIVFGSDEAELLIGAVEKAGGRVRRLESFEPGRTGWFAVRDLCR